MPSRTQATDYLSPSSSVLCCTWTLLSPFLSGDLFFRPSLVSLYLCSPVVSIVMLVYQYNHHFISACVQTSSIFFFSVGLTQAPGLFFQRSLCEQHMTTSTYTNGYVLDLQDHGLDTRPPPKTKTKTKARHPKTKTMTSKKYCLKIKTGS